jgi:hypothetical protein
VSALFTGMGRLSVTTIGPELGIVGDYNSDGSVDAADYVVWRDSVGAATLPNRDPANAGAVGQADYDSWRANFGLALGASSSGALETAVPEPATWMLVLVALAVTRHRHRFGNR